MKHSNIEKEIAVARQRHVRKRRVKVLEDVRKGVLLTASRRLP